MERTSTRWAATLLLGATVGCLRPVGPYDCLADGECECVRRSDCAEGFDCLDGRCQLPPDASFGQLGSACDGGAECGSGLCLPPGKVNGGLCTEPCAFTAACPRGWECKGPPDASTALCAPPSLTLCLRCEADLDCGPLGDRCLTVGGERVCGRDCMAQACPAGYRCAGAGPDGGGSPQCTPLGGTCACTELSVGLTRPCARRGDAGSCQGNETCLPGGAWSGCDALVPAAEVCDGVDNDCDGLVDSADPSIDVRALPARPAYPGCRKGDAGACVGEWSCRAFPDSGFSWSCSAAEPNPEQCNGRDDDCDGLADEPFVDSSRRYVHVRHCGSCSFDCEDALPDLWREDGGVAPGAAACEVRSGAPVCVPKRCAPGYFPSPLAAPVTCERAVSSSCRPCAAASDCAPFDRCVSLLNDVGTYCAQGCGASDPYLGCTGQLGVQGCCPAGLLCQQAGANPLCVPPGGSCSCSVPREGAVRSCFVGATAASCVGEQVCLSSEQWGTCSTQSVTQELCDGRDNNCDGKLDEPFIGTRDSGTYDTDEHCGSCTRNCKALWSPTLQHAIGGCDAGPSRPPGCEIVQCTREAVAGGGTCQLDSDCGTGRACHPLYRQCVRACATALDCPGNVCRGGHCTQACTSSAQCQSALGVPSACDAGACEVSYQFVNIDQDPTNGCECPRSGVPDEPDRYKGYPDAGSPYVDRDCDGVDGVAARALFVFAGSALSQGTRSNPYRTIGEALAVYNPSLHSGILVAVGSYFEQVVLRNGVRLYGGYSPDFSRRDVVTLSTLLSAPEPQYANPLARKGTVNAEGITAATVFAGFTVRGYDVTFRPGPGGAGVNSYAVYVRNSTASLVLANNHVVGGRGGDGAPGTPGTAGQGGALGRVGLDAKECTSPSCAGNSQDGGAAGTNPACASSNGRPGAPSVGSADPQAYSASSPIDGRGGSNAFYQGSGTTGLCKNPCYMPSSGGMAGGDARNGQDGPPGIAGMGCIDPAGAVTGGEWRPAGATSAAGGRAGTGGGGGGAGGCVLNQTAPGCTIANRVGDLGATGGGGGAGGCGGQPGLRGGGGGGSFGIFVTFTAPPGSVPVLEGNLIEPGAGGFGGSGGAGGYGGQGGAGGEGGSTVWPAWCAGRGGHGGRGGNGGAGGGGGGGCGGVAIGIAGNQLASGGYAAKNSFLAPGASAAGSAGAGGASPAGGAMNGTAGAAGVAAGYREY